MKLFGKFTCCLFLFYNFFMILSWIPMTEQYRQNSHKVPFNITASAGITVDLKCKVRLNECGHFYSIEWYWLKPQNTHKIPGSILSRQDDNILSYTNQNTIPFVDEISPGSSLQQMESSMLNEVSSKSERVFVYRHNSGVAKAENRWKGRAEHIYDSNRHVMRIRLSRLKLEDQARYRCEITYKEPGRWFKDSCRTPQVTQLNVIGPPTYVKVSLENDTEIATVGGAESSRMGSFDDDEDITSSAIIGPYKESATLVLKCKAGGGRPVPEVSWWNGVKEVEERKEVRKIEHDNGTGSTESEISVLLHRSHLGKSFTCRVNSSAMNSGPILRTVYVDMDLPPITLDMIQPILEVNEPFSKNNRYHHSETEGITITSEHNNIGNNKKAIADVDEGGKIRITCIAKGAKPQAHIYWNSDPPLNFDDIHEETKREENGLTFTTVNTLTFEAERELTSLSCFASNSVLDNKKETPLKRATNIHVKYKPEIEITDGSRVINVLQGEQVTVECNFNANPMQGTNIEWYKDGSKIQISEKDQTLFTTDNNQPGSVKINFAAEPSVTDGRYACSAENVVGRSEVIEIAALKVLAVPKVNLVILPTEPVSELQNLNVTLTCEENPVANDRETHLINGKTTNSLLAVKWFLDGELLKHVGRKPECISHKSRNSATGFHCNVDPTKIILVNVRRSFHGNYACKGRNQAGWGDISPSKELKVLYPPSGTKITHEPSIILKGNPFKIKCSVENAGYPQARKVRWYHNGLEVPGHGGFILANRAAHVTSGGNYTCMPYNHVGKDDRGATTNVNIYAKPNFLTRLPVITGLPFSRKKVQLKCTVECDPICSISWYRDGAMIGDSGLMKLKNIFSASSITTETGKYSIETKETPANVEMNRLSHVESTLELDFDSLVGKTSLNNINEYISEDNDLDIATYSCNSSSNSVGLAVRSSTKFRLHYPPKDITITPMSSNITEKSRLITPFTCHADAYPPAQYYWIFANVGENITRITGESSFGADLVFHQTITREQSGTYTCTAHNALGNAKANVTLNVFYPPVCRVRKETAMGDGLKLKCDVVSAIPTSDIRFTWYHNNRILLNANGPSLYISKNYREHSQDSGNGLFVYTETPNDRALYTTAVPVSEDLVGTFACEATNIAGSGELCEISVNNPVAALAGVEGSNGQSNSGDSEINYTYVAFGGGAVVAIVFTLALLSILFCRKRYGFSATKYSVENMRGAPSERNLEDDISNHEASKPTSALINQSANTHNRNVGNSVLHGKYVAYKN